MIVRVGFVMISIEEVKANAGCILGDNYYAKDLGEGERSVYWVEVLVL